MSSPVRSSSPSTGHPFEPHWTRPCGGDGSLPEPDNDYDLIYSETSESDILRDIILQAEIALHHAKSFRTEYVSRTFNINFENHHKDSSRMRLTWLLKRDEMPKEMGKEVEHEHLQNIVVNRAYSNVYTFLQKIAVGMEQVKDDQPHPDLQNHFKKCNVELNKLLCELQSLMSVKKVAVPKNVSRDIMTPEDRQVKDIVHRSYRDWLIFREYMNVLEYVIQVFSFVQDRLPS